MTSILERGRRSSVLFATRAAIALFIAMGVAAVTAAGCGTDNGVVGGVCAPGFTECAVRCVDLSVDNDNCGTCGNVCAAGTPCAGGVCGFDATTGDDGGDDGSIDAVDDPLDERPRCDTSDPCRIDCRPPPGAVCGDAGEGGTSDGSDNDGNPGDGSDSDGKATDGSAGEGGDNEASTGDGSVGDGSSGDGSVGDGSSGEGGPADASSDDACTPPYSTVNNCGACNNVCRAPLNVCALDGNGVYTCQPKCAPPLTNCRGACVNLLRDPFNCGTCGNVCPSRLCLLATCQGDVAGNIVVIGHDYRNASSSSQQSKLLNNAIFLNNSISVRVFSFEHYADPSRVANTKAIVSAYAAAHNETVIFTVSNNDDDIPNGLLKTSAQDVLLVYDQSLAPPGMLAQLGARWSAKLSSFGIGGGIMIVLDGGQGTHEMPAFESGSSLLNVSASTVLDPLAPVRVLAPNDALSSGLVNQYAAEANSVRLTTSEAPSSKTIFVVVDQATNLPVVIHKIVN